MHRGHLPEPQLIATTVRRATRADGSFLERLDVAVLAEGLPWAPAGDPLLVLQLRARDADRAARWPGAVREVVEVDGEPVGATLLAEEPGGLRMVDLHLVSSARGRGVGTSVVAALAARADARHLPLRVRTRPDNAAMLTVLDRAGFARVAEGPAGVELERAAR